MEPVVVLESLQFSICAESSVQTKPSSIQSFPLPMLSTFNFYFCNMKARKKLNFILLASRL